MITQYGPQLASSRSINTRHGSTAWIVSDDVQLAEQLCHDLKRSTGCQVARTPIMGWSRGKQPRGYPRWLFLNLRKGDLWDQLGSVRQDCRQLQGQPLALIGIVADGYPHDWALTADQNLATTMPWPFAAERLSKLLSDASALESAKQ